MDEYIYESLRKQSSGNCPFQLLPQWGNNDCWYLICNYLIDFLVPQNLFAAGSDRRVRLMRNSCVFTCIFITCWLPTGIFRLPLDLPRELLPEELRNNLMYYSDVCGILGYFHTCVLPLLLFVLSHDLRKHLCLTAHCSSLLQSCCQGSDEEDDIPQQILPPNNDPTYHNNGDHNQNEKLNHNR